MKYSAKVTDKLEVSSRFATFDLELEEPHRIQVHSGDYIKLADGKKVWVISEPEVEHGLSVLTEKDLKLEIGQEVEFEGPENEVWIGEESKLVLIATGVGIAPMITVVRELIKKGDEREILVHWGLVDAGEIFNQEEFLDWEETGRVKVDIVLFKPPVSGWYLCQGSVADCVETHERDFKREGYYICTDEETSKVVREWLVRSGVESERIHVTSIK
jgi:NAD(P)H-flavin reductase